MPYVPTASIHVIVTSPPYFNAREYATPLWETYQDYLIFCESWIAECVRVLHDGRMCCINVSAVIEPRTSRRTRSQRWNIPADIHALCTGLGLWFQEDIIWRKPEGAAVNRSQRFSVDRHPLQWRANPTTEHILVYQKPTIQQNDDIIAQYHGAGRIEGTFERSDVWDILPASHPDHPAIFPPTIPSRLIQYYSWPGDTVLDPFCGTGTTLMAARKLNRQAIGIEQNQQYCQIAARSCSQQLLDL